MSNTEHSLNILLPTYNNVFPPELLGLSNSLLAQSRSRAPALKADEEIARPYACAEIACKRLKAKLRLPTLQSRPPCPPRVYKKLCTYLEQALPAKQAPKRPAATSADLDDGTTASSTNGTPKKARLADTMVSTPTKSKIGTPAKATPKRVLFAGEIAEKDASINRPADAPPHIMPLIRRLCTAFATSLAVPHVYTAACIVLPLASLQAPKSSETAAKEEFAVKTSALTLALYFMVLAKMQEGELEPETHLKRVSKAIEIAGFTEGILTSLTIDEWLTKISEKGWAQGMEWWDNVPEDVLGEEDIDLEAAAPMPEATADGVEEDIFAARKKVGSISRRSKTTAELEDEEEDPEGVLLPGLGTMMQPRVDWLSEDRDLDFLDWKKDVMAKVRQVESGSIKGKFAAVR